MRSLAVALGLIFAGVSLFGQAGTGTLTGTVTDPSGAVVTGASVQAKNTATGVVYPTTSTNTGNYTLTQLPPGVYELDITVMGFKKYVHTNLQVPAAQIVRQDAPLEVGNTGEAVTVTAEASLLKTESGDLAHNITADSLENLPILGIGGVNAGSSGVRNPFNMVELIPGVTYGANSRMVINGGANNSDSIRIEGQDMTNHYGTGYALQEQQPSAEAIQEVAIQTSNYAAEFGTAGGGLFNITMKSGTNDFHGSGYDYFVNEDLNAAYPYSNDGSGNKVRPRSRRNNYGGTLGGPIIIPKVYDGHNRSFFFFNWEEYLESTGLNFPLTLPTSAYQHGDFSAISPNGGANFNPALGVPAGALPTQDALGRPIFANTIYDPLTRGVTAAGGGYANPFPGNIIPANRLDPVALRIQKLLPATTNENLINNANGSNLSQRTTIIPSLKLDQSIGTKGHLSFYWSKTETDSQYSTPYGNTDGLPAEITEARGTFIHSKTFRINYDHTLTPTLLLHLGAGYKQLNFFDDAPYLKFNAQQELGLSGFQTNRNFPYITGNQGSVLSGTGSQVALGGLQGIGTVAQIQTHSFNEEPTYNANLTWIKGSHTIKTGAELFYYGTISQPFAGVLMTTGNNATSLPQAGLNLKGQSIGFGYASFLLGDYASIQQNTSADYRVGKQQWGLFIQDSWKATRKLTLNYGLRWDYGTYPREQYGRASDFGPNVANPSAGNRLGGVIYEATCNCRLADNYPYGIGPRLGMAYQITPKTVLRAGWGLVYSYTADVSGSAALSGINAPGGINSFVNLGEPGALPQPQWPVFNAGLYPKLNTTSSAPTIIDRNAGRPPRQNQWSIGIQREITPDFVVEASYVGNRGVWWTGGAGPANVAGANLGYFNQVSPATFAAYGLDPYHNAADNDLLSKPINSQAVIQKFGQIPLPYAGFPVGNTLLTALEAYPQFSTAVRGGPSTVSYAPTGKTWYDSLQIKATKRLSHGLQATGTFTWSKALQNTRLDFWNPESSVKTYQATDQPFLFNANIVYTVPNFLESRSRVLSQLTRDWQFGAFLQYGSGALLTPPSATIINNLAAVNGSTNHMVRVAGQPLYVKDLNCHCVNPGSDQLLNPKAWANPATGTWGGNAYYSDFRGFRRPQENFNIGRNFRINERMNFQVRAEFVNIFNRVILADPSTSNPLAPLNHNKSGQLTGGYGVINETVATGSVPTTTQLPILPRTGTLIARFTF